MANCILRCVGLLLFIFCLQICQLYLDIYPQWAGGGDILNGGGGLGSYAEPTGETPGQGYRCLG